jgi:hypothetical protein
MTRTSSRVAGVAKRRNLSIAFVYKEIALGRLRARKAGAATIITDEDEEAWIEAMPVVPPAGTDEAREIIKAKTAGTDEVLRPENEGNKVEARPPP